MHWVGRVPLLEPWTAFRPCQRPPVDLSRTLPETPGSLSALVPDLEKENLTVKTGTHFGPGFGCMCIIFKAVQ